jgi:hypothetical protein
MECDCSSLFVNVFTRTINCTDCGEWKALAWFFLDVHVALYSCHPLIYKFKVRLWDAGTGAALQTLKGHTDSVRAVAFSLDGKGISCIESLAHTVSFVSHLTPGAAILPVSNYWRHAQAQGWIVFR